MKTKPTVLLVEKIHPKYLARLELRSRVVRPQAYDEDTLAALAASEQVDAIVIRTKGCVTRKIIAASPKLKVVARHGIGVYLYLNEPRAMPASIAAATASRFPRPEPRAARNAFVGPAWSPAGAGSPASALAMLCQTPSRLLVASSSKPASPARTFP